jgi:hypothetical protein
MRQQLRLRVLLPVAVLGLLGAGFGAYAFGQPPEVPSALPAATTTTTSPSAEPGEVDGKAWAEQVNALCTQAIAQLEQAKPPATPTPAELEAFLATLAEVSATFDANVAKAGWPVGEKETVLALRGQLEGETLQVRRALAAFRGHDVAQFERLLGAAASDRRSEPELRWLGAGGCADEMEAFDAGKGAQVPQGDMPAALELEWCLYFDRAAVVLFYTPNAELDGAAVLEARSAALSAGAAFVPVNVGSNQAVAELAEAYDVLEAPAVLVFTRGPRVAARFDRLVDRETIAQAVENALR